ncbi:acyltransferase [Oscillospiraceae bacterium WX1]
MSTAQTREYLYIVKALALFSIVCAHCGVLPDNAGAGGKTAVLVMLSVGASGVGVFLLVAGYLFYGSRKSARAFFQGKVTSLVAPWLVCGTVDYLYVALRKGGLGLTDWFLALTCKSHYYFLTVLFACYIVFFYIRGRRFEGVALFCLAVLSVTSITLTGAGILKLNPYINPFNWFIYFILGVTLKKYALLNSIVSFCKKGIWLLALCSGLAIFLPVSGGLHIDYWQNAAIPTELLAILTILGFAARLQKQKPASLPVQIGKRSFSVYLIHMIPAGLVVRLTSYVDFWPVLFLRPFIVITLSLAAIGLCRLTARKRGVLKTADILIGVRE